MTLEQSVSALLRRAAEQVVLPSWRRLRTDQVRAKAPGDLVTQADLDAESLLSEGLARIADFPVVGEEGAAADPDLLRHLHDNAACWIVDPIDGTGNFVAGKETFAIMAALVEGGRTVKSWILHPATGDLFHASAGAGARRNGAQFRTPKCSADLAEIDAGILTGYLPAGFREHVEGRIGAFRSHSGFMCAGFEYAALASGAKGVMLAYRTLAWDHAPGMLLALEAGCSAARFDGADYRPAQSGAGLLAAADPEVWRTVRDLLIPEAWR